MATVIDLFSRRLIGWAVDDHCRASLVCDALKMAIATRGGDITGVVFHSDGAVHVNGVPWAVQQMGDNPVDVPYRILSRQRGRRKLVRHVQNRARLPDHARYHRNRAGVGMHGPLIRPIPVIPRTPSSRIPLLIPEMMTHLGLKTPRRDPRRSTRRCTPLLSPGSELIPQPRPTSENG